jgi:hypothetical protein
MAMQFRNKKDLGVYLRKAAATAALACSLTFLAVQPRVVYAAVPTADAPALAQRVISLANQLKELSEQITTSTATVNQLKQMYTDYQQVLKEYTTLLNQVKSLKTIISDGEWAALIKIIEPYFGSSAFASLYGLTSTDYKNPDQLKAAANKVLEVYGAVPQSRSSLDAALSNSTLTGGGAYFESLSKEAETQLSREYDKIGMMAADNQLIEQRRKDVAEISNGLNKLGDESDLATLQYIARIQAEQLHLTVDMMDAQNRAKSLVELPSTKEAQMKALVIERQIKELQRAKAAESKPSYTPFTNGF